jgi:hypothetical protein
MLMKKVVVPTNLVYDEFKTRDGITPQGDEEFIFRNLDISSDYVDHLNKLLSLTKDKCEKGNYMDKPLTFLTDMVRVDLQIYATEIIVDDINIRPCFQDHDFFRVYVYQLVSAAYASHKRLVFARCYPTVYAMLCHMFGEKGMEEEYIGQGQYYIKKCSLIKRSTMKQFLDKGQPDHTIDELVQLDPASFPDYRRFYDQNYIDAHFKTPIL